MDKQSTEHRQDKRVQAVMRSPSLDQLTRDFILELGLNLELTEKLVKVIESEKESSRDEGIDWAEDSSRIWPSHRP
jgi:hypothetical protein